MWEKAMSEKRYINVATDPDYIDKENARLLKQSKCGHEVTVTFRKYDKYSERCEQCHLVLRSDATDETEVKTYEQLL
jgi:hypothetical protein